MLNSDRKSSRAEKKDSVMALPFVKDDPAWARPGERSSRCSWAVETTGDNSQDWALGAEYAKAALDYICKTGTTPFLNHVVEAMILKGETLDGPNGAILVGFIQDIARFAMFGRRVLKAHEALEAGETMIIKHAPKKKPVKIGGIAKPAPLPSIEIGTRRSSAALLEQVELKRL